MDTRTQRALEVLAQAVEADCRVIVRALADAQLRMERMAAARAANGLASLMRTKATELEQMIAAVEEKAAEKASELRGRSPASRPALVQNVDHEKAEAVREARAAG